MENDLEENLNEDVLETVSEEENPEQTAEAAPEVEEAPAYEPNFTYKVKDEEYEFDEFLRGGLTSKEQEEALRDLYTKSRGLDGYKDKLSTKEHEYEQVVSEAGKYANGFKKLKEHVDAANTSGDYREIAKTLGLDEKSLINYAAKLVEEEQLPEDQRRLLDENRALNDKLRNVESRMSEFDNQSAERQQQDYIQGMNASLQNHPEAEELKGVMSELKKDFFQEYASLNQRMESAGLRPSFNDVAMRLVDDNRHLLELRELRTKQQQQTTTAPDIGNKPILPTVKGNNVAAVEKEFSSLDELREMANRVLSGV